MRNRINYLLHQFKEGKLDSEGKQELLDLANREPSFITEEIEEMITQEKKPADVIAIDKWNNTLQRILSVDKPRLLKRNISLFVLRWAAAAVIVLAISFTLYYHSTNKKENHVFLSDVNPGGNKAILTLADGTKISLTDAVNGDIAKQAGLSITKAANGQLIYTALDQQDLEGSTQRIFNTIETPKGGMWQVRLPDGSMVWLNAASALTYPLKFSNAKQRVVELKGEAYFEIAKDKEHPFVVRTANQEVEVLGTHFNINSYADEMVTKTTLLEGSIQIFQDKNIEILKPGEQSIVSARGITVNQVDGNESIDWKNGYFMFNNEKQESIMRKISRWYNVEIEYADSEAKEVMYYGSISRFEKVSQVLRKFEQTGEVRFDIINNKIVVHKEK
jgi:transmembrane sensor